MQCSSSKHESACIPFNPSLSLQRSFVQLAGEVISWKRNCFEQKMSVVLIKRATHERGLQRREVVKLACSAASAEQSRERCTFRRDGQVKGQSGAKGRYDACQMICHPEEPQGHN